MCAPSLNCCSAWPWRKSCIYRQPSVHLAFSIIQVGLGQNSKYNSQYALVHTRRSVISRCHMATAKHKFLLYNWTFLMYNFLIKCLGSYKTTGQNYIPLPQCQLNTILYYWSTRWREKWKDQNEFSNPWETSIDRVYTKWLEHKLIFNITVLKYKSSWITYNMICT